jgi:subfamily B ATP-binding cassette protein MsbA
MLVSTLLGFVTPTESRVCLDGMPLENIRRTSLRRQFAVVSLEIVLFNNAPPQPPGD